jgi:hypothetical protein
MDINQTYQQIIGEIGTLITIFAPLLTAYKLALALGLDNYIESKISLIKDDNLRKIAENIKIRVENITVNTITMIEAVEKPIIIESIKNGSMTKDDLISLKAKAVETIKNQLTTEGKTDLQNTVGDINSYLDTLIEAKLADLKVNDSSSISKTILPEIITPVVDTTELTNANVQLQADKDNLTAQVNQIANDKASVEQANQQLLVEKQQLEADKQALQSKLDVINNAIATANISNNMSAGGITVNNNDATNIMNGITNTANQITTM